MTGLAGSTAGDDDAFDLPVRDYADLIADVRDEQTDPDDAANREQPSAAARWCEEQRCGLGASLVDAIDEATSRVVRLGPDCRSVFGVDPELGARRVRIGRLSYTIVLANGGKFKARPHRASIGQQKPLPFGLQREIKTSFDLVEDCESLLWT